MSKNQDTASIRAIRAHFHLGGVVMTQGVGHLIREEGLDPLDFISRHVVCDWGDIPDDDKESNNEALPNGGRLFSAYNLQGYSASRIWVITEADRSVTTLLLPTEY